MATRTVASGRTSASGRTLATGVTVVTSGNAYGLLLAITTDQSTAGSGRAASVSRSVT